jgi:hypothetical protein
VSGTEIGDRNARKREKEKERYASMTTGKRREKRAEKKHVTDDREAPKKHPKQKVLSHALSTLIIMSNQQS